MRPSTTWLRAGFPGDAARDVGRPTLIDYFEARLEGAKAATESKEYAEQLARSERDQGTMWRTTMPEIKTDNTPSTALFTSALNDLIDLDSKHQVAVWNHVPASVWLLLMLISMAGSELNGIQSHEDLYVTLAAAAGLPDLKQDLLKGYAMNGTTYKNHLDGYNNLDYWTGKSEKSARREIFYYDETDLMAMRVDGWKMHIGVKHNGDWFDEKAYPSVPYVVNLLMDPLEKVTPDAPGYEYEGRKFFASKLWAPTAAGPFLAAHLKSLQDFPPSQGSDALSMKKAVDEAMKKLENPAGSSN